MQEPFTLGSFRLGKDPFYPETGSTPFCDLAEALGAAELAWQSGVFEMVNVADKRPLDSKRKPELVWLRQRMTAYNAKLSDPMRDMSVQIPSFPEHMTDWLYYFVPAKRFGISFEGTPFPFTESLTESQTLREIIQLIERGGHLDVLKACSVWPLQFDGIFIEDDCARCCFSLSITSRKSSAT